MKLGVLFFVFMASLAISASEAQESPSKLPQFSVVDIINGAQISSDALSGKVLLIDFWATWCEPCKKEMPGYQRLHDRYASRGLAIIGFKVDVMADTVDPLKFLKSLGVHYPIAVGTEEIRNKFGEFKGLPTTLIYDRQGTLRHKIIGFEYTTKIERLIQNLL